MPHPSSHLSRNATEDITRYDFAACNIQQCRGQAKLDTLDYRLVSKQYLMHTLEARDIIAGSIASDLEAGYG